MSRGKWAGPTKTSLRRALEVAEKHGQRAGVPYRVEVDRQGTIAIVAGPSAEDWSEFERKANTWDLDSELAEWTAKHGHNQA
jgi:hypothetical protein